MDYAKKIRQLGYRMTPQRQIIIDAVCDYGSHATAGEIYKLVQEKIPSINRATVYRVLDFFCELQFIAKTEIGGVSVYELVGDDPHHHLVCRECGRIEALADHHFEELAQHLLDEHGFQAELTHLAISGLCEECSQEQPA